jgi:hypothetical protein
MLKQMQIVPFALALSVRPNKGEADHQIAHDLHEESIAEATQRELARHVERNLNDLAQTHVSTELNPGHYRRKK